MTFVRSDDIAALDVALAHKGRGYASRASHGLVRLFRPESRFIDFLALGLRTQAPANILRQRDLAAFDAVLALKSADDTRADINGLRALAVLVVLFFHLDIAGFGGGMTGVDVFFVISGFLITGMVVKPTFSFANFYARRVARLVPALAVTVLLTLVAGYVLMDVDTFQDSATAGFYSLVASSNIYYWLTVNYFDDVAIGQPFLHTWTLSLEWQFYLAWPFLVVGANRLWGRTGMIGVILVVIAASLAAEQTFMQVDPQAVFYNLPFRAFELALGGLLVFMPAGGRPLREITAIIGLALVLAGALLMPAETPFPGSWVLLPVVGAALTIYGAGTLTSRILGLRPLTLIGEWSYAIYLVHWPIITLTRYVLYRPLTTAEIVDIAVATFVAGAALHYAVEKPLRIVGHAQISMPRNSFRLAFSALLVVAGANLAVGVVSARGVPSRVTTAYKNSWFGHIPCGVEGDRASMNMIECKFGSGAGKILVVGDSHSRHFAYGLSSSVLASRYEFTSIFAGGCVPVLGIIPTTNGVPNSDCVEANELAKAALASDYDLVIVSARWRGYTRQIGPAQFAALRQATKNPILVIGPTPFPFNKIPCNRPFLLQQSCEEFDVIQRDIVVNNSYKLLSQRNNMSYADLIADGCPDNRCPFYLKRRSVYADVNHLSMVGSAYYVSRFIDELPLEKKTAAKAAQ